MGAQQLPHRPPWTWGTLVFRFGSGLGFVLFCSSGSVPPVLVWFCWFCSSVRPVPFVRVGSSGSGLVRLVLFVGSSCSVSSGSVPLVRPCSRWLGYPGLATHLKQ